MEGCDLCKHRNICVLHRLIKDNPESVKLMKEFCKMFEMVDLVYKS